MVMASPSSVTPPGKGPWGDIASASPRALCYSVPPPRRHWRGAAVSHGRRPRRSMPPRAQGLLAAARPASRYGHQCPYCPALPTPGSSHCSPARNGPRSTSPVGPALQVLVPTPRMPCESPPTPPAGRPVAPARGSLGGNRPRAPGRGRGARPATPPGHPAWYRGGQLPVTQHWVLSAHPRRGSACAPRPPATGVTQNRWPRCRGSH